jgi:transposase InsO family protein
MEAISREPPTRHRRDGSFHHSFGDIPGTVRPYRTLVIIDHGRRVLLCGNVSLNPTALWGVQQLREAFPFDTTPRYLIFDRDSTFSTHVVAIIKSFGIKPVRTSWYSPWQNGVVERWIGSCRRKLLRLRHRL